MRESFPRQVDRESRGPQGERGLEFSRRKKGETFFLSPHSLGLYNLIVNTSRRVLFLPPSDAYVRSFLYLRYTLIKPYYTHTHTHTHTKRKKFFFLEYIFRVWY